MNPLTLHAVNTNFNMKRRNLISPLVLLSGLFFGMLIISCGKEDPAGPTGPEGGSGSGSVIYSPWFSLVYKPDTIHMANGQIDTVGYYALIDVPKLTLPLVSTADVKMYINTYDASDPLIKPLPYIGSSGLYIDFSAYAQKIELYSNADMSSVMYNGKIYQQYRYMIVPGNTTARQAAPVDWSDYAAVKAYLGLKD